VSSAPHRTDGTVGLHSPLFCAVPRLPTAVVNPAAFLSRAPASPMSDLCRPRDAGSQARVVLRFQCAQLEWDFAGSSVELIVSILVVRRTGAHLGRDLV
jgi:hypothetical protein